MRSILAALAAMLAMGWAAPAAAQYPIINDVIAQTIAGMSSGMPEKCLNGGWTPKPEKVAEKQPGAEPAFRRYLDVAGKGVFDASKVFTNRKFDRRWAFDGTDGDVLAVSDPWAARIASLRQTGYRLSGSGVRSRAIWEAAAADGALLGTYDALLRRTSKGWELSSLDLYSPGGTATPKPLTEFCYDPGDIEAFAEAKAKQAAEREARRAAKAKK